MRIELPKTKYGYYLCVNKPVIMKVLRELGFDCVFLYPKEGLDPDDVRRIREKGYGVYLVWHADESEMENACNSIHEEGIWTEYLKDWMCDSFTPENIKTLKGYLDALRNSKKELDFWIDHWQSVRCEDYENRCGNCHSLFHSDSKYCMWCGTRKGEGKFLPYSNELRGLYGSSFVEKFRCPKCGYTWGYASLFGGLSMKYCKHCGEEGISLSFEWKDVDCSIFELPEENEENIFFY